MVSPPGPWTIAILCTGQFVQYKLLVIIDFSLTVKAATLIFISRRGSAISSAKEGKSIYNLAKNKLVAWAAQTCVHFMKIQTVYTLNSHLLTLKAHNHKMYVFCREAS